MRWSEETTVKFVRLYRESECLWDSSNANYRNKHLREAAYARIVQEMAIDGFGVTEAKQKVKNLQSTYSQELKKIDKSRRNGPEGELYVPSLKWFAIMDSILRNAKEKNAKMKLEPCDVVLTELKTEEIDDVPRIIPCEVSIHEIEEDYPPTVPKRSKTHAASEDTNMKEAFHFMKTLTEMVSNRDEFTVYGEHIANKLRNCGRGKLEVAIAQHYIDEICFKLTMGEYFRESFDLASQSEQQDNHS